MVFYIIVLGQIPAILWLLIPAIAHVQEAAGDGFRQLNVWNPGGWPGLSASLPVLMSASLPASTQLSPGTCGHLRSEPAATVFLSLPHSLLSSSDSQTNTNSKTD